LIALKAYNKIAEFAQEDADVHLVRLELIEACKSFQVIE
jgi:hypothetical protein